MVECCMLWKISDACFCALTHRRGQYPDNPYHFDSGGDPAVIPTLTREEFVGFYKKYYHPTNARLFIAGDESDVYHALSQGEQWQTIMFNSM